MVANGDVLTDLDLTALVGFHRDARRAGMTLALHPVDDPSRYGVVVTAADGAVEAFVEKPAPGTVDSTTINAGTYVVEPDVLELIPPGRQVSVEYEVFPQLVGAGLYAPSSARVLARHRHARRAISARTSRRCLAGRPDRPERGRSIRAPA